MYNFVERIWLSLLRLDFQPIQDTEFLDVFAKM
jgi:hypothetical protein